MVAETISYGVQTSNGRYFAKRCAISGALKCLSIYCLGFEHQDQWHKGTLDFNAVVASESASLVPSTFFPPVVILEYKCSPDHGLLQFLPEAASSLGNFC